MVLPTARLENPLGLTPGIAVVEDGEDASAKGRKAGLFVALVVFVSAMIVLNGHAHEALDSRAQQYAKIAAKTPIPTPIPTTMVPPRHFAGTRRRRREGGLSIGTRQGRGTVRPSLPVVSLESSGLSGWWRFNKETLRQNGYLTLPTAHSLSVAPHSLPVGLSLPAALLMCTSLSLPVGLLMCASLSLPAALLMCTSVSLPVGLSLCLTLTACWTSLDERARSLGYFQDLSGHQLNARLTSQPEFIGSSCGQAIRLRPARDDHLTIEGSSGLQLSSSFSLAVWLSSSMSAHWETILDNGQSGLHNPAFGMRLLAGTVAVDFRGDAPGMVLPHNYPGKGSNDPKDVGLNSTRVPKNEWTHVVYTYDGNTSSIYVNGKIAFSEALFGAPKCHSDGAKYEHKCAMIKPSKPEGLLWLGREAPTRYDGNARALDGALGEVRIYGTRRLTELEVLRLYKQGVECWPTNVFLP